jgi:hypothetical protein
LKTAFRDEILIGTVIFTHVFAAVRVERAIAKYNLKSIVVAMKWENERNPATTYRGRVKQLIPNCPLFYAIKKVTVPLVPIDPTGLSKEYMQAVPG